MKKNKGIDYDAKIRELVDELNDLREFIGNFEGSVKMGRQKRGIWPLKRKIMEAYARKNKLCWVRLIDVVCIWSSTVVEDVAKDSKESDDDSLKP